MLLIIICMIAKLNLGVGEIGFMFCNLHVSLKAAYSVTFDLLILEIMFLFFKNTVT